MAGNKKNDRNRKKELAGWKFSPYCDAVPRNKGLAQK